MEPIALPFVFAGSATTFALVFWGLTVIVHPAFAVGVYRDASARPTYLVGTLIWTLATLVGGVLTVVAYWLVHISSLSPEVPETFDP